jgi:hypothetical protein
LPPDPLPAAGSGANRSADPDSIQAQFVECREEGQVDVNSVPSMRRDVCHAYL